MSRVPINPFKKPKNIGVSPIILIALSLFFNLNIIANNINYRIQHYNTEVGLAQNYVDCIYRDSRGFIWVGTWDGLNRFDGYNFITYRPDKKLANSINDGFINKIIEDKNGDLWIATRNGIDKFIFETEQFIHFQKDTANPGLTISDNFVNAILFDDNYNLWIGTLSGGIEKITLNENLSNPRIEPI